MTTALTQQIHLLRPSRLGGDYATIRLAEIYLSAAEAILNGAGSSAKAVEYVNYIRERA